MPERMAAQKTGGAVKGAVPARSGQYRRPERYEDSLQDTLGNRAVGNLVRARAGVAAGPPQVGGETAVKANGTLLPPRDPGHPLGAQTRAFMESRFKYDFGAVRVHADSSAAEAARAVGATAYAATAAISFSPPEGTSPNAPEGQLLLAHELTHTIQQDHGPADPRPAGAVGRPDDPLEYEAARAAARVLGPHDGPGPISADNAQQARRWPDFLSGGMLWDDDRQCKEGSLVNGCGTAGGTERGWILVDALGWLAALLGGIGWSISDSDGHAGTNLLHNLLGSGKALTASKEWVMKSPSFRSQYQDLLEETYNQVMIIAMDQARAGVTDGEGHIPTRKIFRRSCPVSRWRFRRPPDSTSSSAPAARTLR